MQALTDTVVPADKWAFDADVAAVFPDMLRRSIPDHDGMRALVTDLARRYIREGTDVVDLGCSRGDALAPLVDDFAGKSRFIGVDVSGPMLKAAADRFARHGKGVVDIREHDLRESVPSEAASMVLSVLTLQFTPIEYRQQIVSDVFRSLLPGGAFILVEKVLGSTAPLNRTLVDSYYDLKHRNGYSRDAIDAKRRSLEGVLVPLTAD